jgi:hypothetical protein
MRKQLELILTASLPVVVLIGGFFAVTSRASIWNYETADPSGAAPFYRDARGHGVNDLENPEGIYFGVEISSSDLCGSTTPELDIVSTSESASISSSSLSPNHVYWYRYQGWYFNTTNTDWGTDYAYITLSKDYQWDSDHISGGGAWSGFEYHYREHHAEMVVTSQADVMRWEKTTFNESKFMCPFFRKTVWEGFAYHCDDGATDYGDYDDTDDDIFHPADTHPDYPLLLSRVLESTGVHYFCIKLD